MVIIINDLVFITLQSWECSQFGVTWTFQAPTPPTGGISVYIFSYAGHL